MNDKHIAIRLPNWLGDVIMTLPSLEALTTAGYTFELFGKAWIKDLFSAYLYPTHVISDNYWDTRRLYQSSQAGRALLFTNSLSSAAHLAFNGMQSFGYRSCARQILLSRTMRKESGLHEIEYFWQLAQFAAQQTLLMPKNPTLIVSDIYQKQAEALLKQYQIQQDFFVICPGAIGHGANKQSKAWPHWPELCAYLAQQGIALLACPAPFETKQFEQTFGQDVMMIPHLNLPLYAAVMQRAKQVIANDSGPLHLAAAVQAPVLGVFGQTDPQRTRPWGGQFIGEMGRWPTCEQVLASLHIT